MFQNKRYLFLLFAMLCSFCITAEYSIIKPTSHSCFISAYGSNLFPLAWLALLPLNFFLVILYNRIATRYGHLTTLFYTAAASIIAQLFSALFLQKFFLLPFFLYLWKDIYILLMFQQLWTLIHTVDLEGKERFWYGVIFGTGGFGSIVGSLVPGYFAPLIGSANVLLIATPFTLALLGCYYGCFRTQALVGQKSGKKDGGEKSLLAGWNYIAESRALKVILAIVVLMQISVTLMEYEFHQKLQIGIPDQDMRTAYIGRLFSFVNGVNLFFHFVGTALFVRFFSLRMAHFFIPTVLACNTIGFLLLPKFGIASYNYGTVKVFDYSFFNIVKEMLYIPVNIGEKFQAKAVIDVFAYRSSKALASLVVLLIPGSLLPWSLLFLFMGWMGVVFFGLAPMPQEVESPLESAPATVTTDADIV